MKGWEHITHLSELEKRSASLFLRVVPSHVTGPVTGLVVGEMPGPSTSSRLPLFPYPTNSSGARLQKLSGVPMNLWLGRILRANLFEYHQEWDDDKAYQAACVIRDAQPEGRRVVLLGKQVGMAFGFQQFFDILLDENRKVHYTCIPHPSGRNLEYSRDVNKRVGARVALQFAADYMVAPKETKNAD